MIICCHNLLCMNKNMDNPELTWKNKFAFYAREVKAVWVFLDFGAMGTEQG